jgi:hypothetical protein
MDTVKTLIGMETESVDLSGTLDRILTQILECLFLVASCRIILLVKIIKTEKGSTL